MSGPGFVSPKDCVAIVTGSSGLCGARLVEMLLERGAKTVIAFDITKPDEVLEKRFRDVQDKHKKGEIIVKCGPEGDLTSKGAVENAFAAAASARKDKKIDICYHVAALVGPFHKYEMYHKVNVEGTKRLLRMCEKYKVPKFVYSSSPSTRFTGKDVTGQTEDELPYPKQWLETYAETKAYGEMEVLKANDPPNFMTVSVAPHQVYGPYDGLFLAKILETAGNGNLRIFGSGENKISVCYVDNYAHGLMCGADALYPESPALAKFYICTDDAPQLFWGIINDAVKKMGFVDLTKKWHLPVWLLYIAAYLANVLGWLMNTKLKLSPFTVKMMIIHRYFSIENAKRDLQYKPLYTFEESWKKTLDWFVENWLPKFLKENGETVEPPKKDGKKQD